MKKFLSILLALAVGFTFTFGSAMSAFAYTAGTGYTVDEQKALLAAAYNQAIAGAEAYKVDYDANTYGATADKDITTFTVSKDAVIAGVDAVFAKTVAGITAEANTLLGVTFEGDYDANTNNAASSVDVIKVKKAILDGAKTETNSDGVKVVEAAAWSDYKAELIKLVDKVDVSAYTETKNETKVTAKDGEKYDTAKEAANADIAYAKGIINNAKLAASADATANSTDTWKADSFNAVYTKVFGPVIKIKENKDDAIDTNLVTSLTYSLAGDYATTKSEEAEKANLAVVQAQAKAALLAAITKYENSSAYNKKQDEQLAAYNEAKTYLIDNGKLDAAGTASFATAYSITAATANDVDGVNYVELSEKAAAAKKNVADKKDYYVARGFNWDDAAAEKALVAQLTKIYSNTDKNADLGTIEGVIATTDLTAGAKAALKIDYSEIEAKEDSHNEGKVYTYDSKCYYEAEWTAVKAAIDTFNAAVDAAKVQKDVDTATAALTKALGKIDTANVVYNNISTGAASTYGALKKYAALAYTNAHAADANVTAIYVTFGEEADKITGEDLPAKSVYLWFIEKGARTAKDAAALYADGCKVIDAYKTLATLKTEAAAVVSQINALPATPALTDKAAVVAAKDAYDALPADAKNYVTNAVTLNAAVKAVEKAEAYSVAGMVNALPTVAKLTVADKEAVKAAKDAYKAYADTEAYDTLGTPTYDNTANKLYNFDAALEKIKNLEKDAIADAYKALNNKYVADKLTAEDAAAVKALQDAIAAYIEEYAETPSVAIENGTAKIAAVVAALAPEFGDAEAKAYVQDLAIAVRTAKSGKKVKVTAKADVQTLVDNGYTVTYKFYKSTKKGSGYKNTVNKTTNTYTNTNPVKGKNYYKVKLVVKNADGAVVATTPLTQCKYGVRTIK